MADLSNLKIGDCFLNTQTHIWYDILDVDHTKNRFIYSYQDTPENAILSYWVSYKSGAILNQISNKTLVLITNSHEKLVMQLKYSGKV